MPEFRSGFVAVIGRPNVGKSTLLNKALGQKISIVSSKPQTTRNTIQAVLTTENTQIIFLDTPGIHRPLHKLGEYMVKSARSTLEEVDAILLLTESTGWKRADDYIVDELKNIKTPIILVGNKKDLVSEVHQNQFFKQAADKLKFNNMIAVSAKTGENIDELIKIITDLLPEGPMYYPADWITDHPERFVVAEFIREQVLLNTEAEVPHSVAVDVDEMSENSKNEIINIRATIYVERSSQKGIIIGKNGTKLKKIGSGARLQIEILLGSKVYLDLWVKVKKDWRDKLGSLHEFGYH